MPEPSDPHDTPWWHEGSGADPGPGEGRSGLPGFDPAEAAATAARAADALMRQARLVGWQETLAGGMGLVGAFLRAAAEGTPADEDDEADLADVVVLDVESVDVEEPTAPGAEAAAAEDFGDDAEDDADVPPQLDSWLDAGTVAAVASLSAARDHVRTGECRSCPVCRGLELLRATNPDVVDGIGDALDAIVAMLGGPPAPDAR